MQILAAHKKQEWRRESSIEKNSYKGSRICFSVSNLCISHHTQPIYIHFQWKTLPNELPSLVRAYKDGRVERLVGTDTVPPSTDPQNGVASKDLTINNPESSITARLYLPTQNDTTFHKLPLVVYFHGGRFCVSSPTNPKCRNYLNALVTQAKALAVSVNYRKAPEHLVPSASKAHASFWAFGPGPGAPVLLGLRSDRVGGIEPGEEAFVDRIWPFVCPSSELGNDDPVINPVAEGAPSLAGLGCGGVLVCVTEKDVLRDRVRLYYDVLSRSGWLGVVEIEETRDEDHVFFI